MPVVIDGVPLFRTTDATNEIPLWMNGGAPPTAPRIYLAGKIRKNCWRGSIVDWIENAIDFHSCGEEPPYYWPTLQKSIMGIFDYVGPYFIGCDHGCFHGDNSHGYIDIIAQPYQTGDGHDQIYFDQIGDQKQVSMLCLDAVELCDVVFAWIDGVGAYGSMVEIGYAKGMGKKIVIAYPPDFDIDDMWFSLKLADKVIIAPTAREAFEKFAEPYMAQTDEPENIVEFESPVEEMFWHAWNGLGGTDYVNLAYQYEIPGQPYRVDFAHIAKKVAVEIDGHQYHSEKEQFTKDRKRQRDLEMLGWRFVRFSGSEVYNDATGCVMETKNFVDSINGGR